MKSKNIKQTELVAALREAIGHTAEHFHCLDPHHSSTVSRNWAGPRQYTGDISTRGYLVSLCTMQDLTPDYSMESHQRDHENFLVVSRNRRRRAKALLDFERHDDDELGFRKNDIITVSLGTSTDFLVEVYERVVSINALVPTACRSSHRRMNTVGSESSTASEVRLVDFPSTPQVSFGSLVSLHGFRVWFLKVGFQQSLWRSWTKEAKRYESNRSVMFLASCCISVRNGFLASAPSTR